MPVIQNFRIQDNFFLWEAYQGINNGHLIDEFRIVDNYYLYIEILTFSPGAELWIPGTGLEAARLKNTLFPNNASGNYSVAYGSGSISSGIASTASGLLSTASNLTSHSEGSLTVSSGQSSHAEGSGSIASGDDSHAEGTSVASGLASHAEGESCIASQEASHAEGFDTEANAFAAHSEGSASIASGVSSHAGGQGTSLGGKQIISSGAVAFNHSGNTIAQTAGHGALADNSAILGGVDANIDVASPRSVVLGGNLQKVVAEPDTAFAQELRVRDNLKITTGANKPVGTSAAMVNGFINVPNTLVKTGATILLTRLTYGGGATGGQPMVQNIVNGVSFDIQSTVVTDTGTFSYLIINP